MEAVRCVRFKVAAMGRICAAFMAASKLAEGEQQLAVIGALPIMPSPARMAAQ